MYISLIGCYKCAYIIYKIKSEIITLKIDIQIICMDYLNYFEQIIYPNVDGYQRVVL